MNKKLYYKSLILFIVLVSYFIESHAQQQCAAHVSDNYLTNLYLNRKTINTEKLNNNLNKSGTGYCKNSIPIKVHVVRQNNGYTSFSNTQIAVGIANLNTNFNGAGIEFYQCGSINYIDSSQYYSNLSIATQSDPLYYNNHVSNVINLYIVYSISGALGFSTYPGGVDMIAMNGAYLNDGIFVHEMGHYFGLIHTHGPSNSINSQEFVDGSNCSEEGDYMCDTPADPNLNTGMNLSTCTYTLAKYDKKGMLYAPDPNNFMSYGCKNSFTAEQNTYMNYVYYKYRSYLTCSDVNIDFSINQADLCNPPFNINFTNTSLNLPTFEWDVTNNGITDYTTTNITHSFLTDGEYFIGLKSTLNGNTYYRYKPVSIFSSQVIGLFEDFENSNNLPQGWEVDNLDYGRTWESAVVEGINCETTNAYVFKNYNYTSFRKDDILYTKNFDLTNLTNAKLNYDWAYERATITDTLRIYISTDCGETYPFLISESYGSTLETSTPDYSYFKPDCSDWKTKTLDLSAFIGQKIKLAFYNVNASELAQDNTGQYSTKASGNNLYLDNIGIIGNNTTGNEIGFSKSDIYVTEEKFTNHVSCKNYKDYPVEVSILNAPASNTVANLMVDQNSTAIENVDFQVINNQITFATGNSSSQYFTIRVFDDEAVDNNEVIILTINSTLAISNYYDTLSIHIVDRDEDNPEDKVFEDLVYSEDFNNSTTQYPAGWSIQSISPQTCSQFSCSWFSTALTGIYNPSINQTLALDSTYMMLCQALSYERDEFLISPIIDVSGYDSVSMSFLQFFNCFYSNNNGGANSSMNEKADIDIWDGSAWQNVYHYEAQGNGKLGNWLAPEKTTLDLTPYKNPNMKFRFIYSDAKDDYYWAIDKIEIKGYNFGAKAAITLNKTSTQYLGPFSKIHFYEDNSDEILATIDNNTIWDYGCTTVQIDRQGNGTLDFDDTAIDKQITEKTYLITPTTNNSTGNYNIKLYYSNSEINAWLTSTGNSISKINVLKSGGAIANVSPSQPFANGNTNFLATSGVYQSFHNTEFIVSGNFSTGFSGFALAKGNSNPLPITLLSFEGKYIENKGNVITWSTISEINNYGFELEQSIDGINFNQLDFINGAGNSNSLMKYNYKHNNYKNTTNYYRLKQIDFDGGFEYSNTIVIDNNKHTIQLYPNPTVGVFTIELSTEPVDLTQVTIHNILGETIFQKNYSNNSLVEVDLSNQSDGMYFILIKTTENTKSIKLTKK